MFARRLFWHGRHIFYEPWFAFQKESPNDLDGFTFCAFYVLSLFWGPFIYNGGPHARVRFYSVLSASFCALIDFRCEALPEVISWNGSSLNCLSASFSHLVLFLLSGLVPWSIPGLDGASGYGCWASGCM